MDRDKEGRYIRDVVILEGELEMSKDIMSSLKLSEEWNNVDSILKKEFYRIYNIYIKNMKTLVYMLKKIIDEDLDDYIYEDLYELMGMKNRELYELFYETIDVIEDIYNICY